MATNSTQGRVGPATESGFGLNTSKKGRATMNMIWKETEFTLKAMQPGPAGLIAALILTGAGARAQVNTGSNGSDGALNPTTNMVINMADHPDGICQFTSVNMPSGVTATFIPNANAGRARLLPSRSEMHVN